MASIAASHNGIALLGAPDSSIGSAKPKIRPVQVMQLDLEGGWVDELLRAARNKSDIQLCFGPKPTLRIGNKALNLHPAPQKLRTELYRRSNPHNQKEMSFAGLVSHKLKVLKPQDVPVATDAALEKLKSSMASYQQEKEAKKTQFFKSPNSPPSKTGTRVTAKTGKPPAILKKAGLLGSNHVTRSLPASPSPAVTRPSTPLPRAPTSAPHDQPKTDALRYAIVHFLAIRPAGMLAIQQNSHATKMEYCATMQKISMSASGQELQLSDKVYKELDVWKFPYKSQEDRQSAIDNAIKAYDRMRVSREDKLWQMLLPKEERGKGKVLSKLILRGMPGFGHAPRPLPKRKAAVVMDSAADESPNTKRAKPSPTHSSSLRTPSSGDAATTSGPPSSSSTPSSDRKRKAGAASSEDDGGPHRPTKQRKVLNGHHRSPDTSDDTSDTGLTKRQAVELALKYKEYYPAYEKLWRELEGVKEESGNGEKWERLWGMQARMEDMRRQMGTWDAKTLEEFYVAGTGGLSAEERRRRAVGRV